MGIIRMDKAPHAEIRELYKAKALDERIDEGMLQWFGPCEDDGV